MRMQQGSRNTNVCTTASSAFERARATSKSDVGGIKSSDINGQEISIISNYKFREKAGARPRKVLISRVSHIFGS